MATNFWELLQQHQGDLTKSGRTVAEYLLQHAGEAQYLSISSLAKECCVAEATVFRFCRALGFEGYHEMRIALAQANATGALVNQRVPEPDADTATLCEHASALLMTTINGTQNALSPEAVDRASELLRKARQVYCLGQGGSMLIANDICARFACISTKFRTAGDSHLQLVTASLMTPEDVVLFVSYSGATRDMLETLRTAKAAGAKIILLTHYEDSPGAKLADVVLLCGAQESPLDSGNIPIKVALLYVAEVLVLRYTMNDPQNVMDAQDRTSEAVAIKANVSDLAEVKTMMCEVINTFGQLDVLVNNAGIVKDEFVLMMNPDTIDQCLDLNIKGYMYCTQQAVLKMFSKKQGVIVNVSSVSSKLAVPGQSVYSATKGAVNSMTATMAKELAPYGIRVNAVAPGFIATDMVEALPEDKKEEYLKDIPMKRFGTAEEIGDVVTMLAGPACSYMTGQVIVLDGGLSL